MKISIVTITYNSASTLLETINSIRPQKDADVEFIIIDGGSTDSTLNIIKDNLDIIDYFVSEPDRGISDAFNKGVKQATGKWVGIINSDDKLADNTIKILKKYSNANADILFGNIEFFSEGIETYIRKPNLDLNALHKNMSLYHPAIFIQKKAYEKFGYYDESLKCVMDRDLLLKMKSQGAVFKYIDAVLASYRLGGISTKQAYSVTIPENELISIRYGENKVIAKLESIKQIVNHGVSTFIRRYPVLDKSVRTILGKN